MKNVNKNIICISLFLIFISSGYSEVLNRKVDIVGGWRMIGKEKKPFGFDDLRRFHFLLTEDLNGEIQYWRGDKKNPKFSKAQC